MSGQPVSLEQLVERATGGHEPNPKHDLQASWFYYLVVDPYWLWAAVHAPTSEAVVEESEYDRARMQRGAEFEEAWVREHHPDAKTIEPSHGRQSLLNTCKAMLEGERAIRHAQLWNLRQDHFGVADLLVREDGSKSDLGNYAYRVIEVKRATAVKDHHLLQAAAYHRALGVMQGRVLNTFDLVLPSGESSILYRNVRQDLDSALVTWREIRENKRHVDPLGLDLTESPWRVWANRVLLERMDLTLLPGIGPAMRQKLRDLLMVSSIDDLHDVAIGDLIGTMGRKLGTSIFYHASAWRDRCVLVSTGDRVKMPWGRRSFAMDFETSDHAAPTFAQPPHCYLAGLWDYQKGCFVRFLAQGPGDEERMLAELMDYVGDLDGVVIHSWTEYEARVLREAAARHPGLAERLISFASACVDLKESVKSQVYLPVPSHSIKWVAPVFGFRWRHRDVDALSSMTSYWSWLAVADDALLRKALDYHEDDVRAMVHVACSLDGETARSLKTAVSR